MKIAVVGGGPSGMIAAIVAARQGAEVTLLEKNDKLGKKLYITGKGRCNVTNECSPREFLENVVTNGNFLYSAAYKWDSFRTMALLTDAGLSLKTERGNRVFPTSDKASDVTKTLTKLLAESGVTVKLSSQVKNVSCGEKVVVACGDAGCTFDRVIIATGGVSYPSTGSTGDGYRFAKANGHEVVKPRAALCRIPVKERIVSLEGTSLKNVRLSAEVAGKEICSFFGEMLFTDCELSGPIALSASSVINKYPYRSVSLKVDLKPALPEVAEGASLEGRLLREFSAFPNRSLKNSMATLMPVRLADYVLSVAAISGDLPANAVTAEMRKKLRYFIKNLPFSVAADGNIDEAVVTCGGVDVKQINPSTMQSKLHKNLYFCGEVLDVDAFTGGFNMQIAFSTGYLAGTAAAKEE